MLAPPVFDATRDYGALLGDADHWRPYAELALARAGLPIEPLVSGFTGTYPTLVGTSLVIKLFGHFGGWRRSVAAEIAANEAIHAQRWIRAPKIVATGQLFPGNSDDWPFLISERLSGEAWRDSDLATRDRMNVAVQLGRQVRLVHGCPAVSPSQLHGDWLAEHRTDTVDRQRRWKVLPERLLDQIPEYIAGYRPADPVLVHGDITEDHIFLDGDRLVGLIDWGDAMITDPFYELGALHLGAFGADRRLLGSFLEGYGWPADEDFARHAMQAALMHEFDLFSGVRDLAQQAESLDDLADALWKLS
ncbi:phosphotransferase family protein [Microlunatus soli]|uniref:Phosphotransferase enzyme family protein n=1 Tax=Microlunatus soli TaxID=630515 RepID=A0A1H1SHS4_9ACTN|nr:aminoglycoside phosphotransferase family protein [Microlunatus soli]SDS47286.1 Phosphotransferase enzyme family protein [Microlunatus soli]